jgi:hypothetical protein
LNISVQNNLNVSGDLTVAGTLRYNEIIDTTVTGSISGYTGYFQELYANNLVYNTGDQTINGIKTFVIGNGSRVLISGSNANNYGLSIVNDSNNGDVLFLKKGTNPGGGSVSQNFIIKAVNRADQNVFTLKSTQGGASYAGFFCDTDTVRSNIPITVTKANTLTTSGEIYIVGEANDNYKYIVYNDESIKSSNLFFGYTGGLFFDESGLNLKFANQDGSFSSLKPIELTTGNDVLINGNNSFGHYMLPVEGISSHKLFATNNFRTGLAQNIPISGLKLGNTISVYSANILVDDPNINLKVFQYLMVPGPIADSHNTVNITSGIYSGYGLRKIKNGPTIANSYKNINSLEYGGSLITPKQRYLETVYNINVESGRGSIRPLIFTRPAISVANNPIITLKFNFKADTGVCIVSGRYPNGDTIFTITGSNYDFIQTERLMYHNLGSSGNGFYVRI